MKNIDEIKILNKKKNKKLDKKEDKDVIMMILIKIEKMKDLVQKKVKEEI